MDSELLEIVKHKLTRSWRFSFAEEHKFETRELILCSVISGAIKTNVWLPIEHAALCYAMNRQTLCEKTKPTNCVVIKPKFRRYFIALYAQDNEPYIIYVTKLVFTTPIMHWLLWIFILFEHNYPRRVNRVTQAIIDIRDPNSFNTFENIV